MHPRTKAKGACERKPLQAGIYIYRVARFERDICFFDVPTLARQTAKALAFTLGYSRVDRLNLDPKQ